MSAKLACPCCGYLTMASGPGDYEVCKVCYWEDDPVTYNHPDFVGGANKVSLAQAKLNFAEFGATETRFKEFVRAPRKSETQ